MGCLFAFFLLTAALLVILVPPVDQTGIQPLTGLFIVSFSERLTLKPLVFRGIIYEPSLALIPK